MKKNELKRAFLLLLIALTLLFTIFIVSGDNFTNQTNETTNQINNQTTQIEQIETLNIILIKPIINLSGNGSEAFDCLVESQKIIKKLVEDGFNVIRPNDYFIEANQLFNAQLALDEKKREADYKGVLRKCNQIFDVKFDAYDTLDQLVTLGARLNKSAEKLNISEAFVLFKEAEQAFFDERYEDALKLIDQTYDKTSEIESRSTILITFYDASRKTIKGFFKENWIIILSVLIAITILFFIFRKPIRIHRIKRKMDLVKLRKKTLLSLIEKLQKDYFEKGAVSKAVYHIKLKKFSDLVRDADRQFPLLEFELSKVMGKGQKLKSKLKGKEEKEELKEKKEKKSLATPKHTERFLEESEKIIKKEEKNKKDKLKKIKK